MKDAWSKHVVHKTQLYELAVSHILAHDPFLQRRAFTEFLPLWIQFYTFHICPSSKILHCSWQHLLDITFLKFIATLGIHKKEKRKKNLDNHNWIFQAIWANNHSTAKLRPNTNETIALIVIMDAYIMGRHHLNLESWSICCFPDVVQYLIFLSTVGNLFLPFGNVVQ